MDLQASPQKKLTTLESIGITDGLFLGDCFPFSCVIKNEPSDFIVSEIDLTTSQQATLTCFEIPIVSHPCEILQISLNEQNQKESDEDDSFSSISNLVNNFTEKLKQIDAAGRDGKSNKNWSPISIPIPHPGDKTMRSKIHNAIRTPFPFVQTNWEKCMNDDFCNQSPLPSGFIHCLPDWSLVNLYAVLHSAECESLQRFILSGPIEPTEKTGILLLSASNDKEERTRIYRGLSDVNPALQARSHINDEGQSWVAVTWSKKSNSKKRKRQGGVTAGCATTDDMLLSFILKKENMEHGRAIHELARVLKISHTALSFAGTKDKVAITYQHMNVRGISPERLLKSNGKIKGVTVGNVLILSPSSNPLQLGSLGGNHFKIILRNISEPTHVVSHALSQLKRTGFINFFGTQRVGTNIHGCAMSYEIGLHLLRGEYEVASALVLHSIQCKNTEDSDIDSLSKDANGLVGEMTDVHSNTSNFAKKCETSASITKGSIALKNFINSKREVKDAKTCLKVLFHAKGYIVQQALLQGFVRHNSWEKALKCVPYHARTMWLHAYQAYVWNLMASKRIMLLGSKAVSGDLIALPNGQLGPPIVLDSDVSAEDETALAHRIVLPLVGYNVIFPEHCIKDLYFEAISKDGVKFDLPGVNLKGSYRLLFSMPYNIAIDSCPIGEETVLPTREAADVEFSLMPGSYATMALRELCKSNCDLTAKKC